jgi:hypothetical protein
MASIALATGHSLLCGEACSTIFLTLRNVELPSLSRSPAQCGCNLKPDAATIESSF